MKDLPISSYVYYALCELSDASDNLDSIISHLDDESAKVLFADISKDIYRAISKLNSLSL